MSSPHPANQATEKRLYKRFITTLKVIQIIGYFVVGLYFLHILQIGLNFLSAIPNQLNPINIAKEVFFTFIGFLLGCISVYITTEVIIAIIDLLSRIERNTRT